VRAALQYSLHKQRTVESFFWLKELDDTKDSSIQGILFNSWFHSVGLSDLNVLSMILKNDYMNAVQTICSNDVRTKGLKLYYLHGLTNHSVKKIPPFKLDPTITTGNVEVDKLTRSIMLNNTLAAWHLSKQNWSNDIIKNLYNYKCSTAVKILLDELLNYTHPYKWMVRCAIICIVCMTREELRSAFPLTKRVKPEIHDEIYKWNQHYGFRSRRIYSIPKDCLYGRTIRGGMTYCQTNIQELYDHNNLIKGQAVYDEIIQRFGSYETFMDNTDVYEVFCTNYFPNDIPDEWPLEEQLKSHGIGVNQASDVPVLRRYIQRWSVIGDGKDKQMLEKIITDLQEYCISYDFESIFDTMYQKNISCWSMKQLEESLTL
jgi:hypothetical protein